MLYPVLAVCLLTVTFFVARYLAAKTRLVEKAINDAIGRKLASSPVNNEITRPVPSTFGPKGAVRFSARRFLYFSRREKRDLNIQIQ